MLITVMGHKKRSKLSLSSQSIPLYRLVAPFESPHFTKFVVLTVLLCSVSNDGQCDAASVVATNANENGNNQVGNRVAHNGPHHHFHNNYHFLDQHNEYDSTSSGVSILDDDTVRLSLAIDDDPSVAAAAAGLTSAPSLHSLEPKVYLRVSGESGMIRPDYRAKQGNYNHFNSRNKGDDLPSSSHGGDDDEGEDDDHDVHEGEDDDDDEMSDNYHHHFPYIESYREKYVRPELNLVATTQSPLLPHTVTSPSEKKEAGPRRSGEQVWSDIIAQVTTPSSFNEINSSASEHRLADFNFRANLPSYFYNKYSAYSEEDLENVADLDDEHSKYFVKTRPRSVATSGSSIYSNFYYEPPSFSTKSVPIPVKTNKEKVVFASLKPTHHPQHLFINDNADDSASHNEDGDDDHHHEEIKVMTTISSKFAKSPTIMTPQSYAKEAEITTAGSSGQLVPKSGAELAAGGREANYANQRNTSTTSPPTPDVSTSQSIVSKVTVNSPKPEDKTTVAAATPTDDVMTSARVMSTTEAITTTTDATSIPGIPGVDYPTLGEIPVTEFDCKNQRYKGFFADIDTKCQAWHYCDFTDGHSTFLCPNGTLFSQVLLTCDWWFNVDCNQARQLYVLNERLYRYIKPPKPSFPEDFIGEHVDKWLIQQLQMGLLPKVRKKAKAKFATLPPPPLTEEMTTSPKE